MSYKTFNIKQIVSVKAFPPSLNCYYHVRKERKFLGVVIQTAGVYSLFEGKCSLHPDCFIKDGHVYDKAVCIVRFSNQEKQHIYCESFEEALQTKDEICGLIKQTIDL